MTTILGIDPGAAGAIASVCPSTETWDMPTTAHDLADLLRTFDPATTRVYIEKSQAMPGQGVSSMFKYGMHYGHLTGMLALLRIPYIEVSAATWKRVMGLTAEKADSRTMAQKLFPEASLSRKKDHGRAEALLIAEFGRRQRL